jgi:hypothetical protein
MSRKMLERYSHTRIEAKRIAVELLVNKTIDEGSPQNPPQSEAVETPTLQ